MLEDKYDFSGLSFQITINEMNLFKKKNPNVSVNVYGLENLSIDIKILYL